MDDENSALDALCALEDDLSHRGEDADEVAAVALDAVLDLGGSDAENQWTNRLQVARAVKKALSQRKRRARHDAEESDKKHITFQLYRSGGDCAGIGQDLVHAVVFDKATNMSVEAQTNSNDLSKSMNARLRSVTLYRYVLHQKRSLTGVLEEGLPAATLVASLRVKWDETQQEISASVQDDAFSGAAAPNAKRTNQVVHVFTCNVWFKTSRREQPIMWSAPPRMLQRTTAECIW